ncbi:MAG TPA: peptide deformylase [Candidatus Mcinerneyibacteriales bacterium]|nr:peptide deformylase [Candidatus Mcinerneyibacteriales bacterium]
MYKIVYYGDKRLVSDNKDVQEIDDGIRKIVKKMIKTMFKRNGIGLAAPQVGINKRIVVIDTSFGEDRDHILVLINPQITQTGQETVVMEEGCLSFPELYIPVERARSISVKAVSLTGESLQFEATDYFARVIQHEVDHVNGVLMIDRVSPEKRIEVSGELAEIKKMAETV